MLYNKWLMEQNSPRPEPDHIYDHEAVRDAQNYRSAIASIQAADDINEAEKEELMVQQALKFDSKMSTYTELQRAFAMWAVSSEDESDNFYWSTQ